MHWAEGAVALRKAGVTDREVPTSLSLRNTNGGKVLALAAQHCPNLREISLREGQLSDSALQAVALAMRGRLRKLDLHATRGFGDVGLKALAAFCTGLEVLKVGECDVSDEGLEKVAIFCRHLRLVEVSDTPSITSFSLSHLGPGVTVQRVHALGARSSAAGRFSAYARLSVAPPTAVPPTVEEDGVDTGAVSDESPGSRDGTPFAHRKRPSNSLRQPSRAEKKPPSVLARLSAGLQDAVGSASGRRRGSGESTDDDDEPMNDDMASFPALHPSTSAPVSASAAVSESDATRVSVRKKMAAKSKSQVGAAHAS